MTIHRLPRSPWSESQRAPVAYSIVVPVYNEEESLPLLHQAVAGVMSTLDGGWEVVYVDDGSRDRSPQRLEELAAADDHVRVIQFRRNFGQTAAISAGIDHARGDVLIFMDADLQNDPADIPRLLAKLDEGFDVVSGWRIKRQDALWTRKVPSVAANWLISRITGVHLHDYGCSLKAYRRDVIREVYLYGEMHRFVPVFAARVGATIAEIPVSHHPRRLGTSKYGLNRTFKVMLDLITAKFLSSYFTKPIYVFGGAGLWLMLFGILAVGIALIQKFATGQSLIQTPLLLLAAMLIMMGFQAILMGLVAEVGMRTYYESQGKAAYTVRRRLNFPPDDLDEPRRLRD